MIMRSLCTWVLLLVYLAVYADPEPAIMFVENKNQWREEIRFSARIPGGRMFIEPGRFSYYLVDEGQIQKMHEHSHHINESDNEPESFDVINAHTIDVNFLGASSSEPLPFGKSHEYYNYFIGDDPCRWASEAYAYDGFLYRSFYVGVDLKVYSQGQNLKYDFIVSPGADPNQIAIQYAGADLLQLSEEGDLNVKTSVGEIIEKNPISFQYINGKKVFIASTFRLVDGILTFYFPDGYNPCYELVIDPLLIFSTYSGSAADNWGSTATPGERGTLYSAGVTNHFVGPNFSGTYPATPGAFQIDYGGQYDIGILKYDSSGSTLLYASYLGGAASESPHSLIVNENDELLVLATTSSFDFPTTKQAFDTVFNGGTSVNHVVNYSNGSDLCIARISKDGTQLLASTYLGGSDNDGLNPNGGVLTKNYGDQLRGDINTDPAGNIYVSSVTSSADFPNNNASNVYHGGATDALLVKMNAALSNLIFSTFLGGTGTDASHSIKLDEDLNIYIAGGTSSADFAIKPAAFQKELAGDADGWIAVVKNDGSEILHSTFTGTNKYDQIYFLDINSNNEVYVYGQTSSTDFLMQPSNVYGKVGSGQFLQKFSADLTDLVFSTTFGTGRGDPDISPTAFIVTDCNTIYLAGWGGQLNYWPQSSTIGMEVSADALQGTSSGNDFYFLVLGADATRFLYATFLGGSQSLTHVDGGTSRFDKQGIAYQAVCSGCRRSANSLPTSDFPTTPNAWSRTNGSRSCNNLAFKFDFSLLKAGLQTNSLLFDNPGITAICIPDKIVFENKTSGGERYYWDLADGTQFEYPDKRQIVHEYKEPGDYKVWLRVVDLATCQVRDSVSVVVHVFNAEASIPPDDNVCAGTPTTLQVSGGKTYSWTDLDGNFISSSPNITMLPADTTQYIIEVTENSGCTYSDTVQLNVIPVINTKFDIVREQDCFSIPSIYVRNVTDSIQNTDRLFFDFGDGVTSDQSEVTYNYKEEGVHTIKLVGVRQAGDELCISEKKVSMVLNSLNIPNVITPGIQDGNNDTFVIQYGNKGDATPSDFGLNVSVVVYNRWGAKVYESDDYKNDWAGEDLVAGVYFFEVTVHNVQTCKGWVHVMK